MAMRYLLAAAGVLLAGTSWAHGDHPHPPGEPTNHKHDEPEPEAPIENEGVVTEADKAKTEAPAPAVSETPGHSPPPPAAADDSGWRPRTLDDNSWRHAVREEEKSGSNRFFEPGHFHFELRFGPYTPNIDDGPDANGLYQKYFDGDAMFYFGLEVDWLPLYIPYVGSLGAGFGWGVTTGSGKTFVRGSTVEASAETSLTIFPMYASGVFRADGILRELHVPIVPYLKGGFGFAAWNVGSPNEASVGRSPGDISTGFHFAIGGALALNAFDRSAAMAMYESTGIRYANLFGEFMMQNLGQDGELFVGTETVVLGIALDF